MSWCVAYRGVVAAVVLAVLTAVPTGGDLSEARPSCGDGRWKPSRVPGSRRCDCNPGMECMGAFCVTYTDGGHAFEESQCQFCSCANSSFHYASQWVGRNNRHPSLEPFARRDLRFVEEMQQAVQRELGLASAQDAGDFRAYQRAFPDCRIPAQRRLPLSVEESGRLAESFVAGCAAKWRWAEAFYAGQNEAYLVVVAVFGSALDPQRNRRVVPDVTMLARFYESLRTLALRAIVLHDGLDGRLVRALETSRVQFQLQPIRGTQDPWLERMVPNDARFLLLDALLRDADRLQQFSHVLMTDLHDVRLRSNPFLLMKARPEVDVFVGEDRFSYQNNPFTLEQVGMCSARQARVLYDLGSMMTLNVGVVGGPIQAMRVLSARLVSLLRSRMWIPKPFPKDVGFPPCDMAAVNVALVCGYYTFNSSAPCRPDLRYISGMPLTSPFANFTDVDPALIIHK